MPALLVLATSCATYPTRTVEAPASELSAVPFFPQDRYQCGPAALATVLVERGVETTPDALISEIYLPGRKGSLQLEIVAATRRHGRLPYALTPDLETLLEEVAAGAPVLVLQNLGFSWWPQWHYAVVIGYEPEAGRVLLRSGRQARRQESLARFDRSWALADRWALRVLRPGELPATGRPDTYLRAVVNSRQALSPEGIGRALEAGLERWSGAADLAFAAGNQARELGDPERALSHYEQAIAADAKHVGALNNAADLLLSLDRVGEARALIDSALLVVPVESPLRAILEATEREISAQEGG